MLNCNSNNCWVYFEPYVKVFRNSESALIYNTMNGEQVVVENRKHLKCVDDIIDDRNRAVIKSNSDIGDPDTRAFIEDLRNRYLLDIIPAEESQKPQIIKPPIEKGKISRGGEFITGNLINHLRKLIINFCSSEKTISPEFRSASRQFPFFEYIGTGRMELKLTLFEKIFSELRGREHTELSLFTTGLGEHRDFRYITEMVGDYGESVTFNLPALNLGKQAEYLDLIYPLSNVSISIHFFDTVPEDELEEIVKSLRMTSVPYEFNFIVRGESDLDYYSDVIEEFSPESYRIQPFYDGSNIEFFRDNVMVSSSGFNRAVSHEEIFTNSTFNTENYGALTVALNGSVYGSLNKPEIGNISEASLFELIYRELKEGESWGDVRKNLDFCRGCIYCDICPPITGCEHVIGTKYFCKLRK